MDMRQIVASNFKRLRIEAGLSQHAVADLMGVDRAYISGLEKGKRNPTVITLWHIAKALGAKPADLVAGDRESTSPN